MFKRSFLVFVSCLILTSAWSAMAVPEDLVMYWSFNEGQGAVVRDRLGNGNDGVVEGGAVWVPGVIGTAIQFNGSNAVVRGPYIPFSSRSFTHAMWVNPALSAEAQSVFSQYQASSANQGLHYRISNDGSVRMGFYSNDLDLSAGTVEAGNWHHLTFWYDFENQNRRIYVNGELAGEADASAYLGTAGDTLVGTFQRPDRPDRVPEWFDGIIDDVQVYDRALADEEIQEIMLGLTDPSLAYDPRPEDGADDVPRDTTLSWSPGESAATHDVYFGMIFEDVNDAGRTDARDVLVSQDQTSASYDSVTVLDYSTTYYWRIDEVDAAPDNTIHKGDVWSFTTEPFAYPVANLIATSNGISDEISPPQRTVDGSGLDAYDQHSIDNPDTWLAEPPDDELLYIQYEFDRAYKLHEMLVWNCNVGFESMLGLGLKDVTIEYSENGTDWAMLGDVPFNQGPGLAGYAANTTVDFESVAARYVRLTVNSGWGANAKFGLSEVRFLYIPVRARQPQPADGAADVSVDTMLAWRAGRDAVSYDVYFGAEPDVLEPVGTGSATRCEPGTLNLAGTYYWQVDTFQETEVWEGAVWSFSTQEYLVVEDFESYDDDENRIYDTWLDGWINQTGSTVGHMDAPFAEQTIVFEGSQSMPLLYDNTTVATSEADLELAGDWTTNGIRSLSLYFYGAAENTGGQLFVKINDTTITYAGDAADITDPAWHEWNIDLPAVDDVDAVRSLTIGVDGAGTTGIVYIDAIRLCP